MKARNKAKTIKQRQIHKTLTINKGAIDLNIQCLVDGKEVINEKGHSLVGNFASVLHALFGMGSPASKRIVHNNGSRTARSISAIGDNGSGKVRITCSGGSSFSSSTTYVICHGTGYAGLDNIQVPCSYVSTTQVDVPTVAYVSNPAAGTCDPLNEVDSGYIMNGAMPSIIVGLDDTAVAITDGYLCQIDAGLSASTQTSAVQTASYPSYTRLTRIFTNNTANPIVVTEVGLLAGINSIPLYGLITRDVLSSSVTINASSSMTVNYDISINLDAGTNPGGWTLNFAAVLNSLLRAKTRSVTDCNGSTRTIAAYSEAYKFGVRSFGGNNSIVAGYWDNQYAGITVGTGDTAVSGSEYILETMCLHGEGTSNLIHYGTIVEGMTYGASAWQFDVSRLFENRSGDDIEIAETGLTGFASNGAGEDLMGYAALIARNVLTSTVTVANGEALKVTYTIKVEV